MLSGKGIKYHRVLLRTTLKWLQPAFFAITCPEPNRMANRNAITYFKPNFALHLLPLLSAHRLAASYLRRLYKDMFLICSSFLSSFLNNKNNYRCV